MKNRTAVILVIGSALLLVVLGVVGYTWKATAQGQAAAYRRQLEDPRARLRLAAARALLSRDRHDTDAAIAGARALVELGNFGEVRDLLQGIVYGSTTQHVQGLELQGQACLGQATVLVSQPAPGAVDVAADKVRALVGDVEAVSDELSRVPGGELSALLLQAGALDVEADLCCQRARDPSIEVARTQVLGPNDMTVPANVHIVELESDMRRLDGRLERLCREALERDPGCARARALLFKLHERRGDAPAARHDVDALLALAQIPRADAGLVADALFRLEEVYGRYASAADLALGQKLVQSPALAGAPTLTFELARIEAALAGGQADRARALAEAALGDYEDNPRLVCALAQALIAGRQARAAIDLLHPFEQRPDRLMLPREIYVLALAYMADGQVPRGREQLRHALDLAPDLLPARLALAQSLVDDHAAAAAEADILVAARLCPDHPQVRALQARLVVETADDSRLAELISAAHRTGDADASWQPQDLALAADLVLDDVDGLAGPIAQKLADDPANILWLLADAWRRLEPERRARIAASLAAALGDSMDADPLRHAGPPEAPSLRRKVQEMAKDAARLSAATQPRLNGGGTVEAEALTVRHFVPAVEDTALALVQAGLDAWPQNRQLISRAATLCLVLDRPAAARVWVDRLAAGGTRLNSGPDASWDMVTADLRATGAAPPMFAAWADLVSAVRRDDPDAPRLMQEHLGRHPWSEQALLLAVRQSLTKRGAEDARRWIALAQPINPALARLTEARLDLALGRAASALKALGPAPLGTGRTAGPEESAAEVRARADLFLGDVSAAEDQFDDTAMLRGDARTAMYLRWADVLLEAGRNAGALATLKLRLSEGAVSARGTDQLLARCIAVMPPEQFRLLLTQLQGAAPGDPLLLLYEAQSAEEQGDLAGAEALVGRSLQTRPDTPRGLMALARLACRRGRPDEARAVYRQLTARGGRVAVEAAAELQRLDHAPEKGPAPGAGRG
jgi:lipopolysaccharide biosynthesis regulator YciM